MEVKTKKPNIFKRIKNAWKELDEETKEWVKIVGLWTVDGALWSGIITAVAKDHKAKKAVAQSAVMGYIYGQMDAYRDVAQTAAKQDPYVQMDKAMEKLEQQGKVRKFNF